ncbi:NADH-quinone oxidoreductase subunit C [Kibdelosporangium phytohabitans]|uniref:NADH dehydrogenase n=1 Tax=Kibdelosporangium phytohabitans TaxID=860235 RepID=A0A0N9I549_9PSEU|nr:NADH-quinone oxidoreductase subunit C [Kibdelosporangium phytohabitans]ALG11218.1 NADH dehydrogenase [Kibdelosporangium phytohabitans]MBE1462486.1 NADH-quinone oxidoreductase subunit C [Kibdelosporangium phytohabitans]
MTESQDVEPPEWITALTGARDARHCDFFDFLTAVDELDDGIRVVAHVYSTTTRQHVLLRTLLPPDALVLPTATTVYKGANWHERETCEMFGVHFDGHPNLVPLLLPDGFEGTPLRKDFVLASRVAKQWPGEVDPGQSLTELRKPKRRRNLPPGVPENWTRP